MTKYNKDVIFLSGPGPENVHWSHLHVNHQHFKTLWLALQLCSFTQESFGYLEDTLKSEQALDYLNFTTEYLGKLHNVFPGEKLFKWKKTRLFLHFDSLFSSFAFFVLWKAPVNRRISENENNCPNFLQPLLKDAVNTTLLRFQIKLFWLLKTKVTEGIYNLYKWRKLQCKLRFANCNPSASSAETYETNSLHQT